MIILIFLGVGGRRTINTSPGPLQGKTRISCPGSGSPQGKSRNLSPSTAGEKAESVSSCQRRTITVVSHLVGGRETFVNYLPGRE